MRRAPSTAIAGSITDVPGLRAGHAQDFAAVTGFTVVLCDRGAICGVDLRGGASSVRNPTVARPGHVVERVHAVFLTGGSAFGLDAAAGVMQYLEEEGVGEPVRAFRVPIVTGAALFDLAIGSHLRRPDAAMAYGACRGARGAGLAEGSVGAGTGATVGKIFGMSRAMKGGIGTASRALGRLRVGALAVVNAFGDVVDPALGRIVAGARTASGRGLAGTESLLRSGVRRQGSRIESTTLGIVATNARLDRPAACRLAAVSQVALARTLFPAHTSWDGDLVYALSTGTLEADRSVVEALGVETLTQAILRGASRARGLGGIPAARDRRRPPGWLRKP
ncbi:MAG TPA: P1 family peptidase [Candidatus Polarisedimenticolia bacterium]|jgi:L-aminopeptidase/D-esterase-like protein|nr:P1 family peptidase [Candidatus Polarisedimenticolia bacterium]